jgi:hypothetical protein
MIATPCTTTVAMDTWPALVRSRPGAIWPDRDGHSRLNGLADGNAGIMDASGGCVVVVMAVRADCADQARDADEILDNHY